MDGAIRGAAGDDLARAHAVGGEKVERGLGVAFADLEGVGGGEHAGAAGDEEPHAGSLRFQAHERAEEKRQAGVRKHRRLHGSLVRRDRRIGQHQVQNATDADGGVISDDADARAERIRAQGHHGVVGNGHVAHADNHALGKNGSNGG